MLIFSQAVGDRKGAVFGGLVEAPLRPTNKKYQVDTNLLIHIDSNFFCVVLAFKFEQGSNSTFVFTNTPGHPVIFRPTGISFSAF
jgi:hypothetical protein